MNRNVSVEEASQTRSAQLVDVRSRSEFATGHVARSRNIPLEELESTLNDLDPAAEVLLICQSGQRAEMAAGRLTAAGFRCSILTRGMNAWADAGLPMVSAVQSRWSLERQVRLVAGVIVTAACLVAVFGHPAWIYPAGLVGLGLTMAGLTNFCPMARFLGILPWNRVPRIPIRNNPEAEQADLSVRA